MSAALEADSSRDEGFMSRFPLHRACRDGDVGALVLLVEQLSHQAPLTAEDSCYGWTPIHWAAHYGQLECVARLVQMGCEVNMVTSRFNQTPAHSAAFGGHPQCVVWLTEAGADVNRQDFVGEAPIHKAARSGSLECIQVLLIAGAKPHLRNASGQTAADLAQAHGFHDCSRFISKTQNYLLQLSGLSGGNGGPNGNGAWCGASLHTRKRLLTAVDTDHRKRARRAENVLMQSGGSDDFESMNVEPAHELNSGEDGDKAMSPQHTLPLADQGEPEPTESLSSAPPPPASQQAAQRHFADMCGSLHLTGSPSSCVSHRPAWRGLMGADCGEFLHYGHYHGFGDTAEELSDSSRLDHSSSIQAEHRYKQAVSGSIHLYHGS